MALLIREGITWVLSYFPDNGFCDFEIYMLISIGRARVCLHHAWH